MPRGDLRDRLDGNELDLSMDSLAVVPVKELAGLPRATHVDLSCNLLQTLPDQFCTLTHLVKVDLSKNQLTCLPEDFGALQRLQYLDLFENKLVNLPVSMFKLKSLKYLDLKSNPLHETLMKVAGDCLDDTQCKNCAKRILSFMQEVNAERERRRQQDLKRQREMEAEKRAEKEREMAEERERIKAAKAALKEKRRMEYEAKQAELKRQQEEENLKRIQNEPKDNGLVPDKATTRSKKGVSCTSIVITVQVLIVAVLIGLAYVCQVNPQIPQCRQTLYYTGETTKLASQCYTVVSSEASKYAEMASKTLMVFVDGVREKFS